MKTPWLPRLLAALLLLLAAWGGLCAVVLTLYSSGWLPPRVQRAARAGVSIARADWRREERRAARRAAPTPHAKTDRSGSTRPGPEPENPALATEQPKPPGSLPD